MVNDWNCDVVIDRAVSFGHTAPMNSHLCRNTNNNQWAHCQACSGRIHMSECTSRRDRNRDCCEARHVMLHSQGQTMGIGDESVPMLGTHAT